MKKGVIGFISLIILLSFVRNGDRVKHKYGADNFKCIYETFQGRIDGNYISYYKDGKIRAKGKFENNYRIGKWSVWDSTGRLCTQRVYENPFSFKRLVPQSPKDKLVDLLNVPLYNINYNKEGLVNLFYLHERAVFWEKRIFRYIPEKNNGILFEKGKLINLIQKNVSNDSVKWYTNDEFLKVANYRSIDTLVEKVIGYKIKEDDFFDIDRFVSEKRIIGICPVVYRKQKNDTTDLYWIYYPQLRKYLACEKIQHSNIISKIKTLDDLFFFRQFSSQIYDVQSVFDSQENKMNSKKRIDSESIEIGLIEKEHDLWLEFVN